MWQYSIIKMKKILTRVAIMRILRQRRMRSWSPRSRRSIHKWGSPTIRGATTSSRDLCQKTRDALSKEDLT